MNKPKVKVLGAKPPKRPEGAFKRLCSRIGRAVKAVLLRPGMIVLAGAAGFVVLIGTPHVGWEYQCRHATRGFGTCNSVAWCAYYGIQGRRVERPEYGERCQLVTFLPMDWNKLVEFGAEQARIWSGIDLDGLNSGEDADGSATFRNPQNLRLSERF